VNASRIAGDGRLQPVLEASCQRDDWSGPEALDDLATIVRQSLESPAVVVGQLLLIKSEQMQDGCVNVADVVAIFKRSLTKFVGSSDNAAASDATTRCIASRSEPESARKASSDSGVGGRPVKSYVTRRSQTRRVTGGA
jgi:hypothetical protein